MVDMQKYISDKDPVLIDILSPRMTGYPEEIWVRTEQGRGDVVVEMKHKLYFLSQLVENRIGFFVRNANIIRKYWKGDLWSDEFYEMIEMDREISCTKR